MRFLKSASLSSYFLFNDRNGKKGGNSNNRLNAQLNGVGAGNGQGIIKKFVFFIPHTHVHSMLLQSAQNVQKI